MNPVEQGQKLKYIRETKGYTQEQVANYLGTGRKNYSHYETGRNNPPLDTILKLSKFYQLPVEDLIYNPSESDSPMSLQEELTYRLKPHLETSQNKQQITDLFDILSEEKQREAIHYAKFLLKEQSSQKKD